MRIGPALGALVVAALAFATQATAQEASGFTPTVFELVHIDGAGRTVIVGTAEPGATIELLEDAAVVARAEANERGEWVIAPDGLAAGPHVLSVRTTSADGRFQLLADQTIAIEVPGGAVAASSASAGASPGTATFTIADFAITIEFSAGAGAQIEGAIGYPQLAVVRPGDSPWRLAERYYGTGTLYQLILDANADAIRRAGTLLPGMTITIPDPAGR